MSQPAITDNPAARRQRWVRRGALGAVVLIPLAFAGLFVGALSQSDSALENIPAAIVNEDTLITSTADDGTESTVYAGRLLVSELTSGDTEGFDWKITNADDAEEALANGEVYAILTVPSNFSKSIMSVSGDNPVQADISIRTDDAHSYLGGAVAETVGSTMVSTFGNVITSNYIAGLFGGFGDVGEALQTAADGAGELAGGAETAASGASDLSTGVDAYTKGVDGVASGLGSLASNTSRLPQLASGVKSYTGGVSTLATNLAAVTAGLQADPTNPQLLGALAAISSNLTTAANGGAALASGTAGLPALTSGIAQLSSGAQQLSGGSAQLRSGVSELAGGIGELAEGAGALADGLSEGASQVPSFDEDTTKASSEVAADPVALSVTTDNAVTDVGQGIATFFIPLGLWIGALAVFLVLVPATGRVLASTASNGRVVFSALARAGVVTAVQALLLVALLHLALGVSWALLPATLGFALLMALAFTAFHYVLTIAFGRAGLVVSLFLLAIQITSSGSIYPIELLAAPFQAISPFLPLSYGVSGMHGIISGGNPASVVLASAVLLVFGAASVAVAMVAVKRRRRATSLRLIPITA